MQRDSSRCRERREARTRPPSESYHSLRRKMCRPLCEDFSTKTPLRQPVIEEIPRGSRYEDKRAKSVGLRHFRERDGFR